MASLGSYIRSAARATFSAYRSVPLRWRLAGGSAALTFVILAAFAVVVGVLTTNQLRSQFTNQVHSASDQLGRQLHLTWSIPEQLLPCSTITLSEYVSAERAQIRIFNDAGGLLCTQDSVKIKGGKPLPATPLFPPPSRPGTFQELGYMAVAHEQKVKPVGEAWVLYAQPLSDLDHTLNRVQDVSPDPPLQLALRFVVPSAVGETDSVGGAGGGGLGAPRVLAVAPSR